jgi:hypothetical protein
MRTEKTFSKHINAVRTGKHGNLLESVGSETCSPPATDEGCKKSAADSIPLLAETSRTCVNAGK